MRTRSWVEPVLVAQIKFAEWTSDDQLRQPVFLGLRTPLHRLGSIFSLGIVDQLPLSRGTFQKCSQRLITLFSERPTLFGRIAVVVVQSRTPVIARYMLIDLGIPNTSP